MSQKLKPAPRRRQKSAGQGSFVPKTELAAELWALRRQFIAEGGKLLSPEEVRAEVARRRGEKS
jgi:hypothetical protein